MQRILLDTNIIIHREGHNTQKEDIGQLFYHLDKQQFVKCIHPLTIQEIKKYQNSQIVNTMSIKMESYHQLQTVAPLDPAVKAIGEKLDTSENDEIDTHLINEVFLGRVDYLLSEDKKIHRKAALLGISAKVYRIVTFMTKALADDVALVDYEVLSVRQNYFGEVDLTDPFFETFRADYPGFDNWFHKKCDETAYVSILSDAVAAFLYLKREDSAADAGDITPSFTDKRRLKIGTFKVASNGIRLGERFLKIIFDNARAQKVQEIYVTIFNTRPELIQLIRLLEEWGFVHHGTKTSPAGSEQVYVRPFVHAFNIAKPKTTYPYLSSPGVPKPNKVFIVPINPEYHTKLIPDSQLRTEKHKEWDDSEPYRHSISKSYVSRSWERGLKSGDVIVFYRKGEEGTHKWYTSTATTIGIVESVHTDLQSLDELKAVCRKRTVLTDDELSEWWNYNPKSRPFVVNFLYAYSFKKRPNLSQLVEMDVIKGSNQVPRGFEEIGWDNLAKLVNFGKI